MCRPRSRHEHRGGQVIRDRGAAGALSRRYLATVTKRRINSSTHDAHGQPPSQFVRTHHLSQCGGLGQVITSAFCASWAISFLVDRRVARCAIYAGERLRIDLLPSVRAQEDPGCTQVRRRHPLARLQPLARSRCRIVLAPTLRRTQHLHPWSRACATRLRGADRKALR